MDIPSTLGVIVGQSGDFYFDRHRSLAKLAAQEVADSIGIEPEPAFDATSITGNHGLTGPIAAPWRIFRNANPPAHADAAYAYWPCTDATSMMANMNGSRWTGNAWLYVWANRAMTPNPAQSGTFNTKPNMIQSLSCDGKLVFDGVSTYRCVYSTYEKANAATQSLIRYWLGRSDFAAPWVEAGGAASDFVFVSELYADVTSGKPSAYFTTCIPGHPHQVMQDIPWLPSTLTGGAGSFTRATAMAGRIGQVPGVVLDYEVQDGRSTAMSPAFLRALCDDIHTATPAGKLFIRTNPLDRLNAGQIATGLDADNLPAVLAHTDYLSVKLWSRNTQGDLAQSYAAQMAMLKGTSGSQPVDYAKLVILFELNCTLDDARFVHTLLTGSADTSPQAIMYWAHGATELGAAGARTRDLILTTLLGHAATG